MTKETGGKKNPETVFSITSLIEMLKYIILTWTTKYDYNNIHRNIQINIGMCIDSRLYNL